MCQGCLDVVRGLGILGLVRIVGLYWEGENAGLLYQM